MADVLIIAGSKSDEKIVKKATGVLEELRIAYMVEYASAHREPDRVKSIVESSDAKVIIAVAGLAAALPGFVASLTDRPVIGVPVSAALGGLDALLSIAQMPKGVPVATVGIDNGQNAAHLAARILGVQKEPAGQPPKTYAEAGVDESKVADGLKVIAKYVRKSFGTREVTQDFGHYANTVRVNDELVIALSTDGVGSKVIIAEMAGIYDTIGQDCVAMNVNDLICIGAMPVGFVDYLACERPLPAEVLEQIGQSLLDACRASDIPILGGETAILPDIIRGHGTTGLDLAGTAVGIAHPAELIDGSAIQPGDSIIGIASNGLHSNGFTLARRVVLANHSLNDILPWGISVAEELLKPTRVYVPHFRALLENGIDVRGIAHITGSGFKKILRLHSANFRIQDLPNLPPIFRLIQEEGQIDWAEMFSTFNMGIGLVVIVPEDQAPQALDVIRALDEAYLIGVVEESDKGEVTIEPYGVVLT
ncbi:MAG: phosphoribosylformylglycinamidine cyclo-ligase [Candidatus Thorarchaeota archaeon]|nr:phosphoribosylformylglycinamidine cyclo-ligase [Candidatus Thorarchaeota archaeon]